MTFFEGYITLDLDSADIFHGIGIFCRIFALKDFLSYRPLKKVWADWPTAVRFRVNATSLATFLFADASTCLAENKNLQDLFHYLNVELKKLATWFKVNKMAVNVRKTI